MTVPDWRDRAAAKHVRRRVQKVCHRDPRTISWLSDPFRKFLSLISDTGCLSYWSQARKLDRIHCVLRHCEPAAGYMGVHGASSPPRYSDMEGGEARQEPGDPDGHFSRTSSTDVFKDQIQTPTLGDWTDSLPATQGCEFFRSIDWSTSTLGLPQTWPSALRFAVRLLFCDSRGACIYWSVFLIALDLDPDPYIGEMNESRYTMKSTDPWLAKPIQN